MNQKTGHFNQRKKIVFVLNELAFGGTTKGVLTFCKHLDQNLFEPFVFCYSEIGSIRYYRRKLEAFFSKPKRQRFTKIYIDNYVRKNEFSDLIGEDHLIFGELLDLKKLIKDYEIDLVHFNRGESEDWYTSLSWSKNFSATKFVETSIFGLSSNDDYVTGLNQIFFISEWLKSKSSWDQEKGRILYNPILDCQSFDNLRQELKIPTDSLVVGRISRPGLDDGLNAYKIFNRACEISNIKRPIFYLVLGASKNVLSISESDSRVIAFENSTDEKWISKFYNTMDVLLHYRIEGETFGMNIAEAMMHGKPVVSHLSYLDNAQKELLEKGDEICGLVAEKDDVDAQANLLSKVLLDEKLRLKMSQSAKKTAKQFFEAKQVTKVLEDFYKQLLAQ